MRFSGVALSLRRSDPAEAQDRPVHFLDGPFPSALEEVGARHRGARGAPCPENQDASTRHSRFWRDLAPSGRPARPPRWPAAARAGRMRPLELSGTAWARMIRRTGPTGETGSPATCCATDSRRHQVQADVRWSICAPGASPARGFSLHRLPRRGLCATAASTGWATNARTERRQRSRPPGQARSGRGSAAGEQTRRT